MKANHREGRQGGYSLERHLGLSLEDKSMAKAYDSGPLSSFHGCNLLSLSRRIIIRCLLESDTALALCLYHLRSSLSHPEVGTLILFYS